MCRKEDSGIKTNFYVLRGVVAIDSRVLKVFYGGYCHSEDDIESLKNKALDLFETIVPRALENFNYVITEIRNESSIREIPKEVSIAVARKSDVEARILVLETVIDTCSKALESLSGNEVYSQRAQTKAIYTDYKSELEWCIKLMETLDKK